MARTPVIRALLTAALCAVALAGCGSVAAAPASSTAATPALQAANQPNAEQDSDMVMVTLTDVGYRPSTIKMATGQSTMFMVVNRSKRAQEMSATLSITAMSVQNADGSVVSDPPSKQRSGFDLTIPAGSEVDFTVTPTAAGSYPLTVSGVFGGDLSVTE